MKNLILYLMTIGMGFTLQAQEAKADPAAPAAELRQELKSLTPAQRRARMRELRDKSAGLRAEVQQLRDDLKGLPPKERRAKLKEFRETKLAELKKKKEDGSINAAESRLLQRLDGKKPGGKAPPAKGSRRHPPADHEKKSEPTTDPKA